MKAMYKNVLAVVLCCLALVMSLGLGCASLKPTHLTPTPMPSPTPTATVVREERVEFPTPTPCPIKPKAAVDKAKEDLASRLKVEPEEIEVVSVVQGEFPLPNLGCPGEEPLVAPPALVMGYEIVLKVRGKEYRYRSFHNLVIPCFGEGALSPSARKLVELARQDLAGKLSLNPEAIELVKAEKVLWRDSSLGCPEPNKVYLQVITPGYRIVLRAQGKTFEYHTDNKRVVLCEKP